MPSRSHRRILSLTLAVATCGTMFTGFVTMAPANADDPVTTTPIASGDQWRYQDGGSDLGTVWRERVFDDSGWASGASQLGYGDGDEATVVASKKVAYYFRKDFNVDDPSRVTELKLRAIIDDGAAVYINGVEVWRQNLAANAGHNTVATTYVAGASESTWNNVTLPTSALAALRAGSNTIAVEVHNDSPTSSDISFDLELTQTATPVPAPVLPTSIESGDEWQYQDSGADLGTVWREREFDDSGWASGASQLGYGDGGEATTLASKKIAYYFRKDFNVDDPGKVSALALRAIIDDGAAVYINGVEVWRQNLAANAGYNTVATTYVAGASESTWNNVTLPTSALAALRAGSNTIAVEVHNDSPTSSDISFDLELTQTVTQGVVAPAAPTGLRVEGSQRFKATLAWDAVESATEYVVYRDGVQVAAVPSPAFVDTGLESNTNYSYTVAARNVSGSSVASAPLAVKTSVDNVCTINDSRLPEISGLVHSRNHANILWAHNDSGSSAKVYAVDATTCAVKSIVTLSGVSAYDFEAISIGVDGQGRSQLWVGDIGDNAKARANVKLYRFLEPTTLTDQSTAVETVTVTWDGNGKKDSESLVVEPVANGRIWLVSKEWTGAIYELQGDFRTTGSATAVRGASLGTFSGGSYATDATWSPTANRFVIRMTNNAQIRDGIPGVFNRNVALPTLGQGEALAFSPDGKHLFAASEGVTALTRIPLNTL